MAFRMVCFSQGSDIDATNYSELCVAQELLQDMCSNIAS